MPACASLELTCKSEFPSKQMRGGQEKSFFSHMASEQGLNFPPQFDFVFAKAEMMCRRCLRGI